MDDQSPGVNPDDAKGAPRPTGPPAPRAAIDPDLYQRLRAIAADYLARERTGHTLQPTALVNEAFLRLGRIPRGRFTDRRHFVAAIAQAMRRILVDHARAHGAQKRGGGASPTPLTVAMGAHADGARSEVDLLELNEALERLEALDERQARVVELRFFGGLSVRETADLLGISERTVELDWSIARAWLRRALLDDRPADGQEGTR